MYFNEAGLKELSDFLRVQQSLGTRKELQKELQERLSQECPIREVNMPSSLWLYFNIGNLTCFEVLTDFVYRSKKHSLNE